MWTALQSMQRRKQQRLLDRMTLSAYAWTYHHSLNWGKGGPNRWPEVRPYFTPPGSQDQRGFQIYEWYQIISEAVLQKKCPVMLFQAGFPANPCKANGTALIDPGDTYENIIRLLNGETVVDVNHPDETLDPIDQEVIACCFWLLASDANQPYTAHAWYSSSQTPQPFIDKIKQIQDAYRRASDPAQPIHPLQTSRNSHLIQHYLLLPTYSWGTADWHWNVILPFVRKQRPTVGFSLEEAAMAAEVTVVGGEESFSEEDLNWLRQIGCRVERVAGDGTTIATQLGER